MPRLYLIEFVVATNVIDGSNTSLSSMPITFKAKCSEAVPELVSTTLGDPIVRDNFFLKSVTY